ncbi:MULTISPECIES: hypothetical protein [unclassified Paenibacillus]|uniref:hypothetical protein n=1 Tax=unclassified Paenibacillus TaxID=185978 RepID=UPI0024070297|nr:MULTISPECIES: hypothetical protein [unclassified Paenibacillus]MDF9840228.1 hypothetical protein [Paenibacillus sp. PastF-2]MDF9846810.1 hypothetical protein [Paenibacillus sp. PastM-2]MDF9852841.1 hypothetical protein [Paenibacillus sp. PastF-1]MDH6478654.1 hypothetical protein [Paenibacillus sp. PastH-2]MDH6505848.1 hypothetical protein [Paenibacillus sp. PastM-3]
MIRLQKKLVPALVAALGMLLLQACGQNTAAEGEGESFAAVAEAPAQSGLPVDAPASPVVQMQAATPEASAAPPAERRSATALPAVSSSAADSKSGGEEVRQKESAAPSAEPAGASADGQSGKPGAAAADNTAPGTPEPAVRPSSAAAAAPKPVREPGGSIPVTPAPAPAKQSKSTGAGGSGIVNNSGGVEQPGHSAPVPAASPSQAAAAIPAEGAHTGLASIDWNGFFDGSDQTRPSEHFWDLSGSKVKIKGFMGEVLSFEKNWFLLIPEPGAECPFDNGDETYWNKIMIVFVPGGDKLRYTSGPLEITGRLDVGIKIDESGYKTMFRLYDASFKSL